MDNIRRSRLVLKGVLKSKGDYMIISNNLLQEYSTVCLAIFEWV